MADVRGRISGEYFEACSCDSVCPCPTSGLAARPTKGYCAAGPGFRGEHGPHGNTKAGRLSLPGPPRTPGGQSARAREGLAQPHARLRHRLGRHVGTQQRPLRAVRLELELIFRVDQVSSASSSSMLAATMSTSWSTSSRVMQRGGANLST